MTRRETAKLSAILQHLHLGRIHYAEAMLSVIDLIEIAEREQALEDRVNTSLEQHSAQGTGDDRSI